MSRSGYIEDIDIDHWALIKWRGQVAAAIRGKRGQRLLLDLISALDSLPEKVLIAEELINADGDYCALGAVGKLRGVKMDRLDPEDAETVADAFDIAEQLAREIVYINDEHGSYDETPQERWQRVRTWAMANIRPVPIEE